MFHLILRACFLGNPWAYHTFWDESLNKQLKQVCRLCHQANFDAVAIIKGTEVLKRVVSKRPIGWKTGFAHFPPPITYPHVIISPPITYPQLLVNSSPHSYLHVILPALQLSTMRQILELWFLLQLAPWPTQAWAIIRRHLLVNLDRIWFARKLDLFASSSNWGGFHR